MRVGTVREIKNHEYRVGLTPESVRELVAHGHEVWVESGAGLGIGASDADYSASGGTIKADAKTKKVKEAIVAGSVSNKFVNEDELTAIPAFERLYREWVGPNDLMAGKFRVTAHDFAVMMVLLRLHQRQSRPRAAP